MSKKRIMIIIIVLVVVVALATGGFFIFRWYRSENTMAEVQPVSNLNWGYGCSEMSSYGMVTNDSSKDVYFLENQTIDEIFVT